MDLIRQGIEYIKSKEFTKAIEIFELVNNNRRGFPDGYYYLGIIYFYMKDLQKSKQNFDIALTYQHILSNLDEINYNKFQQWLKEYKQVFKKDFLVAVVDKNESCEKKIKKIKDKLKALEEIDKCDVLSQKLVLEKFKILNDIKSKRIVGILGYVISIDKKKELLLNCADILYELGFYYLSGTIYDFLVEKYKNWYLPYIRVAESLKHINGNYVLAIEYFKKAIELKKNDANLRYSLIRLYLLMGDFPKIEEEFKYIKKNLKVNVCEDLIDLFPFLDIYENGCEKVLKSIENKRIDVKITQLLTQIYYGKYDSAKQNLEEIRKRLIYISPVKIKDSSLKQKLEKMENIIPFFTIGRGGSFFFHSLIDGHPEVATIPGVYFKGYFSSGVFYECAKSKKADEFVDRFMDIYEVVFDAGSKKPVPGNPMEGLGNTTVADASGLTNLGENRDIVLKVDKIKFKQKLLEYLKQIENLDEKVFFQLIHIVWEEVIRGDDFNNKKILFYHIHNANMVEYQAYKRYFSKSKSMFVIRNWLQSLESWMYNSIVFKKDKNWDYEKNLRVFKRFYSSAFARMIHRIFLLGTYVFVDDFIAFVKLEDVKNSPESTMKAVAKWMGISYDECLLRPEFMGLKFHSNKSKLNPTISEFDKKSIKRKVGVLFSEKDARLLNTVLRPWNEVFEYDEGEFKYLDKDEALKLNEEIMDWEKKLIDFFEIKEKDAMKVIKYRKEKLKLALNTEEQIFEELKKVELIKPRK